MDHPFGSSYYRGRKQATWGKITGKNENLGRKVFVKVRTNIDMFDVMELFKDFQIEGIRKEAYFAVPEFKSPSEVDRALELHGTIIKENRVLVEVYMGDRIKSDSRRDARQILNDNETRKGYLRRMRDEDAAAKRAERLKAKEVEDNWSKSVESPTAATRSATQIPMTIPMSEVKPSVSMGETFPQYIQNYQLKPTIVQSQTLVPYQAQIQVQEQVQAHVQAHQIAFQPTQQQVTYPVGDLPSSVDLTMKLVSEQKTAMNLSFAQIDSILNYFNNTKARLATATPQMQAIMSAVPQVPAITSKPVPEIQAERPIIPPIQTKTIVESSTMTKATDSPPSKQEQSIVAPPSPALTPTHSTTKQEKRSEVTKSKSVDSVKPRSNSGSSSGGSSSKSSSNHRSSDNSSDRPKKRHRSDKTLKESRKEARAETRLEVQPKLEDVKECVKFFENCMWD